MKSCNYWNCNSLATTVDNGTKLCDLNRLSPPNLPRNVNVSGADVNTENVTASEGLLND